MNWSIVNWSFSSTCSILILALTAFCSSGRAEDADGDGVSNNDEATYAMNPLDPDTDDDGLPDGWEFAYRIFSNPVQISTENDPDDDGLSNYWEYYYSTHPGDVDTDNDGLEDGHETVSQCDPTMPDTDGDGLTDYDEYNGNGGYTWLWDSDGDGMSDGFEWQYQSVLNIWYADGSNDADSDTYSNLAEFQSSTDPTDANSHP